MNKPFLMCLVGQRGHGKTRLLTGFPEGHELADDVPGIIPALPGRVIVGDALGNFGELAPTLEGPEHLRKLLIAEASGFDYGHNVYVVRLESDRDAENLFYLVNASRIHCTLVMDEVSMFRDNPDLLQIAKYNRNETRGAQTLIVAARRYKEIAVDVRSQADVTVSMRQTEPGDVAELRRLDPSAEMLPTMSKGQFLVFGHVAGLPSAVSEALDTRFNQTFESSHERKKAD